MRRDGGQMPATEPMQELVCRLNAVFGAPGTAGMQHSVLDEQAMTVS